MSRFRAVYLSPEGAKLSGIGAMRPKRPGYWVPLDTDARAGTKSDDTSGLICLTETYDEFLDFYIFHEPCWDRLASHFAPGQLDLERLYAGLEYMPLPESKFSRLYLSNGIFAKLE